MQIKRLLVAVLIAISSIWGFATPFLSREGSITMGNAIWFCFLFSFGMFLAQLIDNKRDWGRFYISVIKVCSAVLLYQWIWVP